MCFGPSGVLEPPPPLVDVAMAMAMAGSLLAKWVDQISQLACCTKITTTHPPAPAGISASAPGPPRPEPGDHLRSSHRALVLALDLAPLGLNRAYVRIVT